MFTARKPSECPAPIVVPAAHDLDYPGGPKSSLHEFSHLTTWLSAWTPSDPNASRRLLVNEIRTALEEKRRNCVKACIPALIVDGTHAVELMHYDSQKDVDELLSRMMWMRQEFESATGIMVGVPDERTAVEIETAFDGLLADDRDCVLLLV